MEYIGQTDRQLKIRMEGHEAGLKFRFLENVGQKEKDKSSDLSKNLKKSINQIAV